MYKVLYILSCLEWEIRATSVVMFVIFLVYAAPMVASGGIMEYQYEDVDLEALGKSEVGGHRLVGARTGNMTEEAPFVVTINIHG